MTDDPMAAQGHRGAARDADCTEARTGSASAPVASRTPKIRKANRRLAAVQRELDAVRGELDAERQLRRDLESRRAAAPSTVAASFQTLFDNTFYSASYCRMIFEGGRPVDFLHLAGNAAFRTRFGDGSIGKRARELTPEIEVRDPALLTTFSEVASTGKPQRFEMFVKSLGEWVDFSVFSPTLGDFVVLAQGINDRKLAEQELRLTAERLTLAQSAGQVGVFDADLATGRVYCTPQMYLIFGVPPGAVLTSYQEWMEFLIPEDRARVANTFRLLESSTARQQEITFQIVRPDGTQRWILGFATAMRESDDRVQRLVGTAVDVTERRQMERDIILASTSEQQRIALDLHDGLGQDLTALSLLASALEKKMRLARSKAAGDVEQIAALAAKASQDARVLAHGFAPITRAAGSLGQALQTLAAMTVSAHGIEVSVSAGPDAPNCSGHKVDHLQRIAREAVWNAIKHGKANRISISLSMSGDTAVLSIRDNGRGLGSFKVGNGDGIGISLMSYRAKLIGGQLSVRNAAGAGVDVECIFPPS